MTAVTGASGEQVTTTIVATRSAGPLYLAPDAQIRPAAWVKDAVAAMQMRA